MAISYLRINQDCRGKIGDVEASPARIIPKMIEQASASVRGFPRADKMT